MAAVRAFSAYTGGDFGGATFTVTKPSGTTSGDVLVVVIMQVKEATTTPTASGWTLAGSAAGGTRAGANGQSAVFYKIAGSSEPTTYSFTSTATATAGMWACTGIRTATPLDVAPIWATTGTSASIVASSASPTTSDGLLLCTYGVLYGSAAVSFGTPTGMTAGNNAAQSGNYARAGYFSQALTAAGSTGTRTSTASNAGTTPTQALTVVMAGSGASGGGGSTSTQSGAFLPFFGF